MPLLPPPGVKFPKGSSFKLCDARASFNRLAEDATEEATIEIMKKIEEKVEAKERAELALTQVPWGDREQRWRLSRGSCSRIL